MVAGSPFTLGRPAPAQAGTMLWPVHPGGAAQIAAAGEDGSGPIVAKIIQTGPAEPGASSHLPVVFLHGLVGLNDHWDGVVTHVRSQLRCICFELPLLKLRGEDCSIEGVTKLTRRFLRECVGGPAVLVGNSFGGHVALRLAIESPELVGGLVLAGSSGLIEKSIVADVQIRPSREWLRRKIGELFFDQHHVNESDIDRAYADLSDRGGARAMVKLSRSARRDVLRDRVGAITAPTLLLWGREDVVTPPEAAERFHKLIAHSRLLWLDRCGHAPMIEAPRAFADALRDFALELAPAGVPA